MLSVPHLTAKLRGRYCANNRGHPTLRERNLDCRLGSVGAAAKRSVPQTFSPAKPQSPKLPLRRVNLTGAAHHGQFTLSYRLLPFSGRTLDGSPPQNRTTENAGRLRKRRIRPGAGISDGADCRVLLRKVYFNQRLSDYPGSAGHGRRGVPALSAPVAGPKFSSLAGAGRPEYRADPLRPGYAQGPAGRVGPGPGAPDAWRIRTPAHDAAGPVADWTRHGATLGADRPAEALPDVLAGSGAAGRGAGAAAGSSCSRRAEANRSQALQQRHALLLGMVLFRQFAAPGANFVLRRDRELVDSRHPRRPRRHALRLRRNERPPGSSDASGNSGSRAAGSMNSEGFGASRTDRDILDRRRDRRLGGRFDRSVDGGRSHWRRRDRTDR